jgi:excisionase family DNA binding protein
METDLLTRYPEQLPAVLKVREAAAYLRLPLSRCYELVQRGEIGSIRFGRSVRIPRQALIDLLTRTSGRGE